jgi:hypothetical protein
LAAAVMKLSIKPFTFSLISPWSQGKMTSTTATPLVSLAQQIAHQQAELEALRQEYETRQTNLAELNRQKQALKAQLQQIEAEIRATKQGEALPPTSAATDMGDHAAASRTPAMPRKRGRRRRSRLAAPRANTLGALVLDIMQQSGGPITVKKLSQEVVRRKYSTTSRNLPAVVKNQIHHLVRRGLARRVSRKLGYIPTGSATRSPAGQGASDAKPASRNGAVRGRRQQQKLPLRLVLTNVLAQAKKPMTAREMADAALASGYKTKSKNFMDVMWVVLGNMNNIKKVPGQGYALKR